MKPHEIVRAYKALHPEKSETEIADEIGISQPQVNRMLSDRPPDSRGSTVERVRLFAIRKGILPASPTSLDSPQPIKITGVLGMGESVEWLGDEHTELGEVDAPFPIPHGCVALEARGDSQYPRVKHGELVIVRMGVPIESLIGEEALVKLEDSVYLLKTIRRGYEPGMFNLESHNAPTRENVRISEAGEVMAYIPRRRWRVSG